MRGRALAMGMILALLIAPIAPSQLNEAQSPSESASNDSPLDLLFIGNSYTSNNQLNVRVENLLSASGFTPQVQALTSGGKTLAWHGEQAETEGSEWFTSLRAPHDYVILQDQSQVPGFPTSSSYWQDSICLLYTSPSPRD